MWLVNALSRTLAALLAVVLKVLTLPLLLGSDILITLANVVLPRKSKGQVVDLWERDVDGHKTLWPAYTPPEKTDSRSPCVALNCMANMGILPRDGRGIAFPDLERAVRRTFNTSPTFARLVTKAAADLLHRDFRRDTLDLSDLCVHNGIEHDASVTRHDTALQPDQSKPASDLVDFILNSATGTDAEGNANSRLTLRDITNITRQRREDSRAANPQFTQSVFHILTGSTNRGVLKDVFGGHVRDLKIILHEERLPEGWEPSNRSRFGMTIHNIVFTALAIELGVKEKLSPRRHALPTTSE